MKTSRAKSKEIKSLDGLRMERIEFGVLYLYVFDGNLGISIFFGHFGTGKCQFENLYFIYQLKLFPRKSL